jgi:NitT/TauT family transport system substrate-binding protein
MPIINLSTKRADLKPGEGTANMKHTTLGHSVSGRFSRRQVLKMAGGLGLAAAGMGLLDACGAKPSTSSSSTGALEITTIRLPIFRTIGVCTAPLYLAEDFLKQEGFTSVQYFGAGQSLSIDSVASGVADITMQFSGPTILYIDGGKPVTMLAGVHVGCFVLFGSDKIKTISDLKGKTLAISQIGGPEHVYLASMLAQVNIDPVKDVTWQTGNAADTRQHFIDRKIDAIMAFPPVAQELFDKQIGHVIANSMVDKPWASYFCCMVTMNQNFVQNYPVATKAALRAVLNATDVCALHPDVAAKLMVKKGFAPDYKYALEAMEEIPYNRWRLYDPEDTVRFYSLLLNGVGMIKNAPDQIIQKGTNWSFLKELKIEMPATPVPAGSFAATRSLLCAIPSDRTAGQQGTHTAD